MASVIGGFGKAYLSWLASKDIIPLDEEVLELVYTKHEVKTFVSDLISIEDALLLALSSGIIDSDDILKELSLASEDEALQGLVEDAIKREDRRRLGTYVDVWDDDSGEFTVTSPLDISGEQATKANEEVERTLEILSILVTILEGNVQLIEYFVRDFKERIDSNR